MGRLLFPHDEFYDASMRDVMVRSRRVLESGARGGQRKSIVGCLLRPTRQNSRTVCVSLSDPERRRKQLPTGDFIIVARGRRYFSNDALITPTLRDHTTPIVELKLDVVTLHQNLRAGSDSLSLPSNKSHQRLS